MTSYDHRHPKGTKYTGSELKRHRNEWYKKITGNAGIAPQLETIEADKKAYSSLIEILPWNRTILFIRTNNFAGFSFERKRLDDFSKFIDQCSNPKFEYIDPDLEGLRIDLRLHMDAFMATVALETFPVHLQGRNSIPEEWADAQPERFRKAVTTLHQTAQKICDTYDALIKTAKRKLGALPA